MKDIDLLRTGNDFTMLRPQNHIEARTENMYARLETNREFFECQEQGSTSINGVNHKCRHGYRVLVFVSVSRGGPYKLQRLISSLVLLSLECNERTMRQKQEQGRSRIVSNRASWD